MKATIVFAAICIIGGAAFAQSGQTQSTQPQTTQPQTTQPKTTQQQPTQQPSSSDAQTQTPPATPSTASTNPDATSSKSGTAARTTEMPEMKTQTYKGALVDASCSSGSGSDTQAASSKPAESASDSQGNSKKQKNTQAGCSPSASTSQFALKTNDGKTMKFDSVGNHRAQEAFKAKKKWADAATSGKVIHAKVSGVLNGDTITVISVD